MKKVESSRKANLLKFKKLLAMLGLALTVGTVAAPTVAFAEEEVLYEDKDSSDAKVEDANPSEPAVTQENGNTEETKTGETVNDGTVDTSAGTNPEDAQKDPYNGNNNDYFDEYDKSKDPDKKGGEYIDSPDEVTRKGLDPTPTPTPTPTPGPEPTPTPGQPTPTQPGQPTPTPAIPTPVAKTGDDTQPWIPAVASLGVTGALAALYALRNRLALIKEAEEVVENRTKSL